MSGATRLAAAASRRIVAGGSPQVAAYGPLIGGFLQNPASPTDQGVDPPESLFVSFYGDAADSESGTTFAVPPGGTISFPSGLANNVSVNATTTGHAFSGVVIQPALPPPTPFPPGTFPPDGPTTLLKIIPSYLYWQYQDDADLQATRDAFNGLALDYLDWFNAIQLPVYTSDTITGDLLDRVASGLYGIERPSLPAGTPFAVGPFDTYVVDGVPFDFYAIEGDAQFLPTTDDDFKRILTWLLYKGDGRTFTVRWLKRRIARFLTGVNGTGGAADQTYDVSVTFPSGNDVHIDVGIYNPALKAAMDAGVLNLPPQFNFIIVTG